MSIDPFHIAIRMFPVFSFVLLAIHFIPEFQEFFVFFQSFLKDFANDTCGGPPSEVIDTCCAIKENDIVILIIIWDICFGRFHFSLPANPQSLFALITRRPLRV